MQVILTMLAGLVPGMLLGGWLRTRAMRRQQRGWPEQWDLQPRPLFTAHERALYRELRAALPQHLILAKVGAKLTKLIEDMAASQAWKDELTKRDWMGILQTGKAYEDYIKSENTRIEAILKDLGLA